LTTPLPIDDALPEIVASAADAGAVVVEAPPGAGKTTRVPRALLEAGWGDRGEVWVLEPRRIAARLAATRVAAERGEPVGDSVGYAVRFDEVGGPRTRLRFLTEGLFLRRLLADPRLRGVAAVVLDELHERHVATDLSLALLRHLRAGPRPDLTVVAMSATLEADPVRAFLGADGRDAALVRSAGRLYDVAVEHLPAPDARPLADQVAGAVRRLAREEQTGDILVFLPGAGEIRRAQEALAARGGFADVLVLPLHGEMPLEEQARAIRPADRRKIVLATNVAESSVTIEGVVAVVDAGLARVATHSPWTGLPALTLAKVSRASAVQRAGRAGRTRPGRALRLYTAHDFAERPAHDLPEIARADLAEARLALGALGVPDPDALAWLDPPPPAAWGAAHALLMELGALDGAGALTGIGRRMAGLPVPPRLARLVVEAEARGALDAGCLAAALVSERDIRSRARANFAPGGPRGGGPGVEDAVEITDLVDAFRSAAAERFRPDVLRRLELDRRAVDEVARTQRSLLGAARGGGAPARPERAADEETALRLAVLAAFPDRVARRRPGEPEVALLASGGSAAIGRGGPADWLIAVDVEERKRGARSIGVQIRLSSAIEPEWLIDLGAARIEEVDRRAFNAATGWVERTTGLRYGALALDESTTPAPPDEQTARLLAEAAAAGGLDKLPGGDAVPSLLARLAFARGAAPDAGLPALGADDVIGLLRVACQGRRSLGELDDVGALVLGALPHAAARALAALAPERVAIGSGRTVPVHYPADAPPWIESRLQDFFGTRAAPAIAGGRVPLTLHLLAPNGRAVQVTRDLGRFWTEHYPALRRELGRRYPKHAWPEDGATARPPPPPARRR
jgi:ATP-dependent helicase HrpB